MFPLATRLRVETKAIVLPSSLIEASRLSSATNGAMNAPPGEGTRLAVVLVICLNVPEVKSVSGNSAPLVRLTVSVTVNW